MQQLYEDNIISDNAIEDAELAFETGKINLKSLSEQINQAGADLEKAQDELKKTTIISPMNGTVTRLNAEVGEQVIMGTINNPGTVIMVISDMREVLAEVDVDETEIVDVKEGNESRIKVDAIGDKYEYEGNVEQIRNTAIRQGEVNIFQVKVKIRNSDDRLRPGMTSRAKIETESRYDVLKAPIQAVILRDVEKEKEKSKKKEGKEEEEEKKDEKQKGEEAEEEKAEKETDSKEIEEGDAEIELEDVQDQEQVSEEEESKKEEKEKKASEKWEGKEQEVVYLMVEGKAVITPVETGISDELDVEIKKGLKEGDVVVTGPYRTLKKLKDGDKIKEKEEKKSKEKEEEKEEEGEKEEESE
jgi:HlyD family secretion protein